MIEDPESLTSERRFAILKDGLAKYPDEASAILKPESNGSTSSEQLVSPSSSSSKSERAVACIDGACNGPINEQETVRGDLKENIHEIEGMRVT